MPVNYPISGTSATLTVGDAVVAFWDAGAGAWKVKRANTATLAVMPTVFGVVKALSGGPPATTATVALPGDLCENGITGLNPGGALTPNIVALDPGAGTGASNLIRVERPNGSEFIIGSTDPDGNLSVQPRASRDTSPQHVFNVLTYGVVADGQSFHDGSFLGGPGTTTLTSPSSTFTTDDVGKFIVVANAGSGGIPNLVTTIAGLVPGDPTSITLGVAATNPDPNQLLAVGATAWTADNTTAFTNAINAIPTTGGILFFPASAQRYVVSANVTFPPWVQVMFDHGAVLATTADATTPVVATFNGRVRCHPNQGVFSPGAGVVNCGPDAFDVISILNFCAACDGVTDDTLAIRAALRAAASVDSRPTIVSVSVGATTIYTRTDPGIPYPVDFRGDGVQPGISITVSGFGDASDGVKTVLSVSGTQLEVAEAGNPNAGGGGIRFQKVGCAKVSLPAGTARTTDTLEIPHQIILRGAGHQQSVISANHTKFALAQYDAVNVGAPGRSHFSDFGIEGNGTASIGFYSNCGFSEYSRIRIAHCIDGLVFDQAENVTVTNFEGDNNTRTQIWLVNGPDVVAGTRGGYTNVIHIRDGQFYGGQYGIADDGGGNHHIHGCTFHQQATASIRAAGVAQSKITNCDMETAGFLFHYLSLTNADPLNAPGGVVQLEVEKCITTSQHTVAPGAGPDVIFRHCQFRSSFGLGPSTAFNTGGYATRFVFEDCIDLQGYGLLDSNPTAGRIEANGGSAKVLITDAYQSPFDHNGDRLYGTLGDVCWNAGASAVDVDTGLIPMTVSTDGTVWIYTRTDVGAGTDFSANGFKRGMRVRFSGFANVVNDGVRDIIDVAEKTLTVAVYSPAGIAEGPTANTRVRFTATPFAGWINTPTTAPTGNVWSAFAPLQQTVLHVRGAVIANVADLANFGNVQDGITYSEGDRVLLAGQTNNPPGADIENGVYVVGPVSAGLAPLTRTVDMPSGVRLIAGTIVEAAEAGTAMGNTTWKLVTTGRPLVDTDALVFYPRIVSGNAQLDLTGVATIAAPVLDAARTNVALTRTAVAGAGPGATVQYEITNRTAGLAGGSVTVQGSDNTTAANPGDQSTLQWTVINW